MNAIGEIIHEIDDGTLPDESRRKALIAATSVMGGIGLLGAAVPFVASLEPSEATKARGGAVTVDTSAMLAGSLHTVSWRGKPVWLMRRSNAMVRALQRDDPALADSLSKRSDQPRDCLNPTRSVRPDFFVAVGICTHLGCIPTLRLDDVALNAELHAPGGFLCPCHGSRFDLAGRVVKNVPAPTNLEIPDYRFSSASLVTIG